MDPTYFLAPNWTTPVDGPIQLGNIIKQPFYPHRYLKTITKDDPGLPKTYEFPEKEWSRELSDLSYAQIKLYASVRAVADNVVKAKTNASGTIHLKADKVTTISFEKDPTPEHLARWVQDDLVQAEISSWSPTVLYMVSGLKIARGFRTRRTTKSGKSGELRAIVPDTGLLGVNVGTEESAGKEMNGTGSSKAGKTAILAYQLLEIRINRNKTTTNQFHHDAAFLGDGQTRAKTESAVTPDALEMRRVSADDADALDTVAESLSGLYYVIDAEQWDWMSQDEAFLSTLEANE